MVVGPRSVVSILSWGVGDGWSWGRRMLVGLKGSVRMVPTVMSLQLGLRTGTGIQRWVQMQLVGIVGGGMVKMKMRMKMSGVCLGVKRRWIG